MVVNLKWVDGVGLGKVSALYAGPYKVGEVVCNAMSCRGDTGNKYACYIRLPGIAVKADAKYSDDIEALKEIVLKGARYWFEKCSEHENSQA